MPSFISAAVAALSLSSLASANVAYRRQEAFSNSSSSSTQLSTSSSRSVPLGTGSSSIMTTSSSTAGAGSGSGSGSGNSTATATTGSSSSTTGSAPASSTSATTFNGVSFLIEFDITYQGVSIDLNIVLAKRAGNSLQDCLATCAANTQCVATAYNTNTTSCTFFSSFDKNTRESAPGIDFAQVTGRPNNGSSNSTSSGAPFPSSTQSNNGTSVTATPNPGNNGTFPDAESIICPTYNDQVLQETDGSQYLIRCGLEIEGIVLLTRKARMVRRQATFGNDWIVDCIDSCSAMDTCVGTTYNSAQGSCTFYSSVDSLAANADTDSAILVNEGTGAVVTSTVTEGEVTQTITTTPLTTSTVYSTTTRTIQSCAPGVPCSAATVTDVVVAYTTVCPATQGGAAAGAVTTKTVCTACQYAPSTVTVYQCPTNAAGAGQPVAVTTTVISVPVLAAPPMTTSTVYQTSEQVTTTCGANGCSKATVTAVVSLYTTVCPVSSGAAGASGAAPSPGSETVVVPGTTVPASTIPATVVNGSSKPAETVPASTKKPSTTIVQYTPTSSMVAYTGAAVKNGMGFAAMAAGVAALVL